MNIADSSSPNLANAMLAAYPSIAAIPKFPRTNHTPTWTWNDIKYSFFNKDILINTSPDYQRGFVWSQEQKERFIEYKLQGGLGGNILYWNYPNQDNDIGNSDWHNTIELVDGKQRLNAVLDFLDNKVMAFGKYLFQYDDYKISMKRQTYYFEFHINNLPTKKEVVKWYLGLNNGGSIHTEEDLSIAYSVLLGCS
jgi:hypothetical protein